MKKMIFSVLLTVLLAGCGSGTFHVPKQEYQSRVQVLGVLPLLVDRNTTMNYPYSDALFDILSRSAADKHQALADELRKKKGYFDVRTLQVDPQLTALSLLGPAAHDKNGYPLGYSFDLATVSELTKRNVVDALLVVVFSGEQVKETRRSRTKLETLNTDFSDLLATAAVVDRNGQVLWQLAGEDSFQALLLQYADFDEAYYNRTDVVKVKNISISGIERALDEDPEHKGTKVLPEMYEDLFSEIASGISPGLLDSLR